MMGSLLTVFLVASLGASEPLPRTNQAAKAEPDTRAKRPAAERAAGALSPGEVVGMLDAYALVQAQETLQLTDAQYPTFVTRLKKLHETRRRGQQERIRILRELRQLAGPQATVPVDEAAVRDQLKALRDLDERSTADLRRAYDALDEVLDVRQQARFRIFEEMIERRKMDLLMRARQGAAGRRGGGQ